MMDQELIAYFDQHFRAIDERFRGIDERFRGIDERFRETSQQISGLREEANRHFERIDARFEQVDETARHTVVLVEGLRHEVHLIAEAFLEVGPKLELYHSESRLSIDDVKRWMERPFRELDSRVRYLEGPKERRYEDVMDEVRRVLGKPPRQSPPVASD